MRLTIQVVQYNMCQQGKWSPKIPRIVNYSNKIHLEGRGGGGRGYSMIWAIQKCADPKGMVFVFYS